MAIVESGGTRAKQIAQAVRNALDLSGRVQERIVDHAMDRAVPTAYGVPRGARNRRLNTPGEEAINPALAQFRSDAQERAKELVELAGERSDDSISDAEVAARAVRLAVRRGDIYSVAMIDDEAKEVLSPTERALSLYYAATNRLTDIRGTLMLTRAESPWYKVWHWKAKAERFYLHNFKPDTLKDIEEHRIPLITEDGKPADKLSETQIFEERRLVRRVKFRTDWISLQALDAINWTVTIKKLGINIKPVTVLINTLGWPGEALWHLNRAGGAALNIGQTLFEDHFLPWAKHFSFKSAQGALHSFVKPFTSFADRALSNAQHYIESLPGVTEDIYEQLKAGRDSKYAPLYRPFAIIPGKKPLGGAGVQLLTREGFEQLKNASSGRHPVPSSTEKPAA